MMQVPPVTHTLKVFFRGLQEPVFFEVTEKVAGQVVWDLTTGDGGTPDEDILEVRYLRFELAGGDVVMLFAANVILVQHLFDFGYTPDEPPPPLHFGRRITEDDEERWQWARPQMVVGVDGQFVEYLSGISSDDWGMIGDSVREGFAIANFLDFTDDDGEVNVVNRECVLFVLMSRDLIGVIDPVRKVS